MLRRKTKAAGALSNAGFPAIATAHTTYANLADLQIGRDMYCAQVGQKVICYVTNYGPAPFEGVWGGVGPDGPVLTGAEPNGDWPDITSALGDAVERDNPFGTVAMIYDPSKTTNQVSFYAFKPF